MAETRAMTTADDDKAKKVKADAEAAEAAKAKAADMKSAKPAAKAGETAATTSTPSPTQAEADAIKEGKFKRNRIVTSESGGVDYKTR